jgi:hypothetical protein
MIVNQETEKKYYRSAMCSNVGVRGSGVVDVIHLPYFPQNSPQLSDTGSQVDNQL